MGVENPEVVLVLRFEEDRMGGDWLVASLGLQKVLHLCLDAVGMCLEFRHCLPSNIIRISLLCHTFNYQCLYNLANQIQIQLSHAITH